MSNNGDNFGRAVCFGILRGTAFGCLDWILWRVWMEGSECRWFLSCLEDVFYNCYISECSWRCSQVLWWQGWSGNKLIDWDWFKVVGWCYLNFCGIALQSCFNPGSFLGCPGVRVHIVIDILCLCKGVFKVLVAAVEHFAVCFRRKVDPVPV